MIGEGELFVDDRISNFLLVSGIKRRQSCHQFVKQSSERVKIHPVAVPTLLDHFRRHVLSASAVTVSHLPAIKPRLG